MSVATALLKRLGFVAEYRFHPERRWRFDFADPKRKVAIEIEGGLWNYGRHNRPEGYMKDLEKYNQAALMGWKVLRYDTQAFSRLRFLRDLEILGYPAAEALEREG